LLALSAAKDAKADVIIKQEKYALENPGAAPLVIEPWDSNQISPGTGLYHRLLLVFVKYMIMLILTLTRRVYGEGQ
jgi:hypothetical protein